MASVAVLTVKIGIVFYGTPCVFNKNVQKSFNNNVLATKNLVKFAFRKKNTKLI